MTFGNSGTGTFGTIDATNSILGTPAKSYNSTSITAGPNGQVLISDPSYNASAGEVLLASFNAANIISADNGSSANSVLINPGVLAFADGTGSSVTLQASNSINVNSPVSVQGELTLEAGNTITLNAAISSTASGNALNVVAPVFVNNAGSIALSTPNGRWLVYSTSPTGDNFGGLSSNNTAVWDASFGSNAPATLAAGNRYVFAYQPSVTVTANTETKVFDGTTTFVTPTYTSSGLISAASFGGVFTQDTLSGALNVVSPGYDVASYQIGQGNLSAPAGYLLTYNSATASITPLAISVSTSNVAKTYDGTTSASGTPTVVSGALYNGDALTGGSYAFTNPNAGSGNKTVTVSGIAVTNSADAGNYTITDVSNTTSTINPEPVTVSTANVSKTYDGTLTAIGSPVVTSGSLYNSDTLSGGSYAFTNPNAGSGNKTVTVSGIAVTNSADAGNYTITDANNTTSTINQLALTVTGEIAASKTYNANTATSLSNGMLSGVLTADGSNVVLNQSGHFTSANAASGITVVVTDTITGSAADNYSLVEPTGLVANITPAPLTVTANNEFKLFGTNDPAFAYSVSGNLYGSDTVGTVLSGRLSRAPGVNAGVYTIGQGTLVSVDGNYTLSYNPGTLTIEPLVLVASSNDSPVSNSSATSTPTLPSIATPVIYADSNEQAHHAKNEPDIQGLPISVVDGGIRMPESTTVHQ